MKDWNRLYSAVEGFFKAQMPGFLTYHNWQHTLRVLYFSEFIAEQQALSEEDILLLKTAALYHDTGFIHGPQQHEENSFKIAEIELPGHHYLPSELMIIEGLIQATKIPQQPKTPLEEILADADLEYLGTDDFTTIGESLYHEMQHFYPDMSRNTWNELQISFMKQHRYHTTYCIQNRLPKKLENLKRLIDQRNA
ncbi:MAG: HD domain-containing protein [Chitinophagaceae bacterium]|nr:HD domain-containing protein [Chitinophagaceae bacterium]